MLVQEIIDATHAAIERGRAVGTIRDVPPAETAAVLTWMIERAGYQLVRSATTRKLSRCSPTLSGPRSTAHRSDSR